MNKTRKEVFESVLHEVSNTFDVPRELILGTCRRKEYVDCRKAIVYILYNLSLCDFSHPMLVDLLNKSNHATTVNLLRKAEDMILCGDLDFFNHVYDAVYNVGDDIMMTRLIRAVKDAEDTSKNRFKVQKFR